jgi:hypothetical protein
MRSRGAAVIAAFALIALAIFVRGRLVDDGGKGDGSDRPDPTGDTALPVVACTPDLVDVCDALAADGKIDADPPVLDLPGAADPDDAIDGWITWSPAPAIADFAAGQPAVWADPAVLGSARNAVLIDAAAVDQLPPGCAASPTWSCLIGVDGLTVGVGEPSTAEGIARLTPIARTFASDDDYTTLDTGALDDLVAGPDDQRSAAEMAKQMTQPGFVSMTTGPSALLARQAKTPQGEQRGLRVLAPSPKATLTVVLAPRRGRAGRLDGLACTDLSGQVTKAIAAAGLAACTGSASDALAGFLYQVQRKVG